MAPLAVLTAAVALTLPAPAAPLPRTATALTTALRHTRVELDAGIARWDTSRRPTREVTLLALYEQRLIRRLATSPALRRAAVALDPSLEDDVVARADLTALSVSAPLPHSEPRVGAPPPATRLLAWYREAQARFHVRWQLLAAVHFVESAFGKVRNTSGAGARGPMQFLPATWRAYGLGGDVNDPHDAILGAANYLAANDGSHRERDALYHYNHSSLYVDAVSRYANRIAHDSRAFLHYYSWQVYFRTATGYRRVTGPR